MLALEDDDKGGLRSTTRKETGTALRTHSGGRTGQVINVLGSCCDNTSVSKLHAALKRRATATLNNGGRT
jgi:hypothetical protein